MDRDLSFEGVLNFRDVGGYETSAGGTIAWRRLLRSGALADLQEPETTRLRDTLQLRTVIDLRHPEAVGETGTGPIEALGVRRLNLSVLNPHETVAANVARRMEKYGRLNGGDVYFDWLNEGKDTFRDLFRTLADDTAYPVLVHCSLGKDRTGIAVGLVLDLLGVAEDVVVEDFVLSDRDTEQLFAFARPMARWAALTDDELRAQVRVQPAWMVDFLAKLRGEHGSARAYLLSIGVDEAALDQVVANLTDA
jgi:protein tyrosine/serine phosphatase